MKTYKAFFRSGSFSSVRFLKADSQESAERKAETIASGADGDLARGPAYRWTVEGVFEKEAR